jgi:hypothetical protein
MALRSHPDLRRSLGLGRVTPTEAPVAKDARRKLRLGVGIGWLAIVAVAFVLGYLLAGHDAEQSLVLVQGLQTERDRLTEQLASERDARMKRERSHQIDVEAQRVVQQKLAELDEERIRLERKVGRLTAMIGASGRGFVEVESLVVTPEDAGLYAYRLALSQLVPDFDRSEGRVLLSVVIEGEDGPTITPVADLSDTGSGRHDMSFERFEVFEGDFRLGDTGKPMELIVEILPKGDNLQASREVVPWASALGPPGAAATAASGR